MLLVRASAGNALKGPSEVSEQGERDGAGNHTMQMSRDEETETHTSTHSTHTSHTVSVR